MTKVNDKELGIDGRIKVLENDIYKKEVELDDIYGELGILKDIMSEEPHNSDNVLLKSVEEFVSDVSILKSEIKYLYLVLNTAKEKESKE